MKLFAQFIFIFIFLTLVTANVFAGPPAQPETYFFKLSKSLRGVPPTLEERQAFALAVQNNTVESFLQNKIHEYMNEDKFAFMLKQKVDELIRVRQQSDYSKPAKETGTAYDRFVFDLVKNNQSWDQLLTGKFYRFGLNQAGVIIGFQDADFYSVPSQGIVPAPSFEDFLIPSSNLTERQVVFAANDPRVAGVVTTPRFFARYVNTALNKNRKRAAAIFRIFLCDNMAPSVPAADSQGEGQDFDTIFPGHKDLTEDDIRRNAANDVHGQIMDCKACHYKLDPMGQLFGFSAATMSPVAAPGALTYKGADGRDVNIPLGGLGDMANAVILQPEYQQCQVRQFWTWFIGKDVPVSRTRETELVKKFNELARKPQDFISYLVTLPEFKERPQALTEDQLLARRAVKIMKNCNSCHQSQDKNEDVRAWDMTDLPYSQDQLERDEAIRLLRKNLDIDHDGLNKKMPPKDSVWKLGQEDFNTLKTWIEHGAPDFDGKPQVTPKGTL